MPNSETNTGLIVPVDIIGLCVGINDENHTDGTGKFAGATTTFTDQLGSLNAFVGSNVIRPLSETPLNKLTAGIHLHWALPEALRRGNYNKESTKLAFAHVPNRWLLSRIVLNGTNFTRKSWIIESDSISYQAPGTKQTVTLPVKTIRDTDPNFMFVGKPVPFTQQWTDPGDQPFETLTGNKLSAVSSGDVSFAAFYPNAGNVFGFYDDMSDIAAGAIADVMYHVTGWFSNAANDPLHGGKTLTKIQEQYDWTFQDGDAVPSYTLYSGLLQKIEWDVNRDYIINQPHRGPVNAVIAMGNNPAEAFAAYFRDMLHKDSSFFEQLLNAFQAGLLNEFKQPQPDQLAQMEEIIYQKQFAGVYAGTIYSVVKKQEEDKNPDIPTDEPVNTLPLDLAEDLNALNVAGQQLDFFNDYMKRAQWQLFSDWYRLMYADNNTKKTDLISLINLHLKNWKQTVATASTLNFNYQEQLTTVQKQVTALGPDFELKADAAPRYWQPNEPVIMISTSEVTELRYGNAGKNEDGYLPCRLTNQVLTAMTVQSTNITAAQFAAIDLPAPNNLPDASLLNALLQESCMLNTDLIAAITNVPVAELETGLTRALEGQSQSVYTFTGKLPSDHSVEWWSGDAWHPILMHWEMDYAPLQPTESASQLLNYSPEFFTNNYSIDQDAGGELHYVGSADPKTILAQQKQEYSGTAVLSPSAADSLLVQLNDYLNSHTDATLEQIRETLHNGKFLSAALNGFSSELLMQRQNLQLTVKVGPLHDQQLLTKAIAQVVGQQNTVSPQPHGHFNPLRAGYMQPRLMIVDVYGQKRDVNIERIICSESLTTRFNNNIEPGIVYMPARISQPARLMFRWLSATGDAIEEMNAHPATTPVCGWLLPNHLDGSLFIYNQQGKALGTLMLNGSKTSILWQSAPGDNGSINKTIEEVFEFENPQLGDLAIALRDGSPGFFMDFARTIDSMSNFVNPQNYAQSSDMAVLIGRPVAITQVLLRIEMQAGPQINQGWTSILQKKFETDNGSTQVKFPAILGDVSQVNDGLLGYFLPGDNGYNYANFFSEAASGNNGVIKPTPTTITLTASPKPGVTNPQNELADALTVLMLVDPRADVHATTGILPTKKINIPPDQYMDTLSILEMTFLTTPVLKGVTGFNLPVPKEEGYEWSWVQAKNVESHQRWTVTPGVQYDLNQAVAAYTPQSLNEGWLRLNPQLLEFEMLNNDKQPQAISNAANELTLIMTNKKPVELTFTPGQLVIEGSKNTGSIFYIHFGRLVPQDNVPLLNISCENWQFQRMDDQVYGNYWAATPLSKYIMGAGTTLNFKLTNVITANITGQVQVYVDYYNIEGVNDGVNGLIITLTDPAKNSLRKKKTANVI
jgi:hypothetical protein